MPASRVEDAASAHTVRFGPFEVELHTGHLFKHGKKVALREQAFQVLALLLKNAGQVVTRDELRQRLWHGDVFVDFEKSLNAAVVDVRQALGDRAENPRYIETLTRRGYRFVGDVYVAPVQTAEELKPRTRLVVLPFVNLSGDAGQEYFSDAVTDEVITALAGAAPGELAVIARTTAMHYKHGQKDVGHISRELGVDYVVEGSVHRSEDHIHINVQLIQTRDQTHLFARKYETRLADMFSTEALIAQGVASCIPGLADKIAVGAPVCARLGRKPTNDLVAYNLYALGRYYARQWTPDGIEKGKQYFEQAVERDQQFALAYYGLADAYWAIGFLGLTRPKDAFSRGVFAALRAIEIDNTLAQAHALLGTYRKELDYNWSEVHREMSLALQLDPTSPDALFCYAGSELMALGLIPESVATLERALQLDPLSVFIRSWLAVWLYLGRQYDRAIEEVRVALEIDSTYFVSYLAMGMVRCEQGLFAEAIAVLHKAAELSGGSPFVLAWLGMTLARSGRTAEARNLLADLHERSSHAYVLPTSFAWTHLGLGEIDEAYNWMDRAIDDRDPVIIPIKTYPFLDPLRSHPRFRALMSKMNFAS